MKTIGMIGGTGWVSSLEYYRLINEHTNNKLGGLNAAKCILYSVNYAEIDAFNKQNNTTGVFKIILKAAKSLKKAGAEFLILCANTMHQFADVIEAEVNLPLIHIGEETAIEIGKYGLSKVGLLGTLYTMEMDFYHNKLSQEDITSIVPNKKDRDFINQVIMEELLLEKFFPESKKRLLGIIEQLKQNGAQGIILGCTEIPLLVKSADVHLPLFNTTEIHAKAAVEFATS